MEDMNNHAWISYDKFSDQETMFFKPVCLNGGQTWTKLTFTIVASQYVSLELYKITEDKLLELVPHKGNNNEIYYTLPLKYKAAEGENVTLDSLKEDFLDGDSLGYLHGISIRDHVQPAGEDKSVNIEDALSIEPSDSVLVWKDILRKAADPNTPRVTAENLYAFGFNGMKYIPPEGAESVDIGIAAIADAEISIDDAVVQNFYDANGQVTSTTDSLGNTTTYGYTDGFLTSVTDALGNATKYSYDEQGRLTTVTDAQGNKTTDAMGTEVLFEYNANDQLVKMTQNQVDEYHEQTEELVTLYEYDGRNLVTKVVQSTGSEELYVYDGNGNVVSKTDGDGYVTEYTYNSLDLVSHISYNGARVIRNCIEISAQPVTFWPQYHFLALFTAETRQRKRNLL